MKTDFKPYQTKNRFWVEKMNKERDAVGAQVVDAIPGGTTVGASSVREAEDMARFARAYVKRHGDIDLACFPYSIDQELLYDRPVNDPETDERPWYFGPNAPQGYPRA